MDAGKHITVICPTLNEEKNIEQILRFFVNARPVAKELYIVDGGSSDQTTAIVKQWIEKQPNIHLLDNPDKYAPFALNKAIQASTGDPIIRLDAHTQYAGDYLEKIISTFNEAKADIVGGPMRPVGNTSLQLAIARATSTAFGIGDSKFHDENYKGYVDSVYLGAWKREIFSEVGYFDEQLIRNQDDEFHYRAKSKGKKIFLNPEIRSWYYPRSSFRSLFKQYFQYGLYKPLVLKKVSSAIKARHLIPLLFLLYCLSLPLALYSKWYLFPLLLYGSLAAYFSFKYRCSFIEKLLSLMVYPTIHLAYGSGFLVGLFKARKH